jgi:hypothetical protein
MLTRFCRYVDKVFDFQSLLGTLTDGRQQPRISTVAVFLSVMMLFALRRGSLNAIEQDLRTPRRLEGLVGPRLPSADTLGRVYALLDSESLRKMLAAVNHRLTRNKAVGTIGGLRIAAIDGHEFFR